MANQISPPLGSATKPARKRSSSCWARET